MRKIKQNDPLTFFGILFLAFGITYLNSDNMGLEHNYKAYTAILLGGILSVISLRNKLKIQK